jgi:hypothetical protein
MKTENYKKTVLPSHHQQDWHSKQKGRPHQQAGLSVLERKLKKMYSRLPFSFSEDWDSRLEPPV